MSTFDLVRSPLAGTNLLEASAGTGKTYTIAGLFLRLVLEKGLRVDQILVVTYTVAATEELRDRIRKRLRDGLLLLTGTDAPADDELLQRIKETYSGDESALARLRRAITGFDEAAIYTIHGFCQRMLLENAFESSALFDTELLTDSSDLVREIVDDFWRRNLYDVNPLLARYVIKNPGYGNLRALADKLSIDPSFTVVPVAAMPDATGIARALSEVDAVFSAVEKVWRRSKNGIEELISCCVVDKKLSGTWYKQGQLPGRIEKMEQFISCADPLADFEQLKYFTSSKIAQAAKNPEEPPVHEFFDLCESLLRLKESLDPLLNGYILGLKTGCLGYVRDELRRRKHEMNIRAFDDLLEDMHRAIIGPGGRELVRSIRGKFHAALIDEFQDTDSLQYAVFTGVFESAEHILYLIGDPKQAIYRFRGADIFAYMKAASRVRSRATLGINHRSDAGLIGAINAVFSRARNSFVFDEKLIGFTEVSPPPGKRKAGLYVDETESAPLRIWFMGREFADDRNKNRILKPTAEALAVRATAAEISRLLVLGREGRAHIGGRALQPGDIAVLVRKRSQARLMQHELRINGIPGVLHGAESIFCSSEALGMERIMAAAAEPGRDDRIKAALGTGILGHSGNEIHRLMEDEAAWQEVCSHFMLYHDLWARYGFMRMFRQLMEDENVRVRLLAFSDGERRLTNVLHCAELIHRAGSEERMGFENLLRWFSEKRADGGEGEEMEQRLETDEQAVKLVTIHRSKGLEYPVVFCPFMWGSFGVPDRDFSFHAPSVKSDGEYTLTLDIGSADERNRIMAEKEELAENVRLMYVAMTRAKHRCYLVWGAINESETSAPAWIFHQGPIPDLEHPAGALRKHVTGLSDEEMLSQLRDLAGSSGGTIALGNIPADATAAPMQESAAVGELSYRRFNGRIARDWAVTSYTALTSGAVHDAGIPDHDAAADTAPTAPSPSSMETIFGFPRGAGAGTCIHSIFEELDFTLPDEEAGRAIAAEKLERYGFDRKWLGPVWEMVRRVLAAPLDERLPGLFLGSIGKRDRLTEMEFAFPLKLMDPRSLARAFDCPGLGLPAGFPESIGRLGFAPRGGFMRGFIDLVFRHAGRYYLVDWKSNHLGDAVENYSEGDILRSMTDNYYILQYHLYVTALHRFLGLRIPGYDYRRHFGGVYYIYVRGVDPARGPAYGIYRDLPQQELIERLDGAMVEYEETAV